jgi:hypothetical protein
MAVAVVGELAECEDWGKVWASRVCSFADFRDRSAHRDVQHCPRLPWWEALMSGAEKWKSYAPVPIVDVERAREWLDRQVMPALAMVLESDGDARWLWEALARGESRWSRGHKEALKVAAEYAA